MGVLAASALVQASKCTAWREKIEERYFYASNPAWQSARASIVNTRNDHAEDDYVSASELAAIPTGERRHKSQARA